LYVLLSVHNFFLDTNIKLVSERRKVINSIGCSHRTDWLLNYDF